MASSLTRDFTATPTNADKFTISFWVKFARFSVNQIIMCNYGNSGNDDFQVQLRNDNTFGILDYKGGGVNNNHESTRKFEDSTSWYHIVIAGDSTQGTGANRLKFYVNGVQETSWASETDIGQNTDYNWNKETAGTSLGHVIGKSGGGTNKFTGHLAHIHNVDGTAYTPSTFGETDSTSGEWKPKLTPSVTYGNCGWFLKMENSSALGTDSSGNSATFTVAGDLKQSVDTPTNNFAVFDKWQHKHANLVCYSGTGLKSYANSYQGANLTQMVKTGKWYFEVKSETDNTGNCYGIALYKNGARAVYSGYTYNSESPGKQTAGGVNPQGVTFFPNPSTPILKQNNSDTNYGTQASANDIIMCAIDLSTTSLKIWFGRNGTWFNAPGTSNVGNPASGTNIGMTLAKGDEFWGIQVSSSDNQANNATKFTWINMGNGYFGTTAVSSGNADGNGIGGFEYAVPSGFYAICSKNIKTYG